MKRIGIIKYVDEHTHRPNVELGLVALQPLALVAGLTLLQASGAWQCAPVAERVDGVDGLDVVRGQAHLRVVLGQAVHDRLAHAGVGVKVSRLVPHAVDHVLPRVHAEVRGETLRIVRLHASVRHGVSAVDVGACGIVDGWGGCRRGFFHQGTDRVRVVQPEDVANLSSTRKGPHRLRV